MKAIALSAIRIDGGTQIRAAIDQHVVADYAEAMTSGAMFPPVVVFHDGSDSWLADGFHRVMAAQRLSFRDIAADVRPGTKDDAVWFALGANKANGKRLSTDDKRHAIRIALQMWPDRSGARIAEQVGCSAMYVSTIKSGLSATLGLPSRVVGRDGVSYPSSPSSAVAARDLAKQLLVEGKAVDEVREKTGIGRDTLQELRRGLGLAVDKTQRGIEKRKQQMRTMAAEGHSSRQIAAAVGLSEQGCRTTLKREGIDVPADKVTRGSHRHDSNRIVERMVMDAENLTEGINLIEFADLDRARLSEWLRSLSQSRDKFGAFIRRLQKEQQRNGEAA